MHSLHKKKDAISKFKFYLETVTPPQKKKRKSHCMDRFHFTSNNMLYYVNLIHIINWSIYITDNNNLLLMTSQDDQE